MISRVIKVPAGTPTTIFTAEKDIVVSRFSIVNTSSGTATLNVYKSYDGVQVSIMPEDMDFEEGACILWVNQLVLTARQSIIVVADKDCDCDFNSTSN